MSTSANQSQISNNSNVRIELNENQLEIKMTHINHFASLKLNNPID
jgi:hypothetical protein